MYNYVQLLCQLHRSIFKNEGKIVWKGWRIQNRKNFERENAGEFSVSNFPLHCPLVNPVKTVSRNGMESVSKEGKMMHRELF